MTQKTSAVIVYTGDGKGKSTAALGLLLRAFGAGKNVVLAQFIKSWQVSEDVILDKMIRIFHKNLQVIKGGKGFYKAGKKSAKGVSDYDHKRAAAVLFRNISKLAESGKYDLIICDEINNAVYSGLLSVQQLANLIESRHPKTSLCLTGRGFPEELLNLVDIATEMRKIKHHYDQGHQAMEGIDF
jgi:cob(I)alamin adenosyltransferase